MSIVSFFLIPLCNLPDHIFDLGSITIPNVYHILVDFKLLLILVEGESIKNTLARCIADNIFVTTCTIEVDWWEIWGIEVCLLFLILIKLVLQICNLRKPDQNVDSWEDATLDSVFRVKVPVINKWMHICYIYIELWNLSVSTAQKLLNLQELFQRRNLVVFEDAEEWGQQGDSVVYRVAF
jgi:hypothetical protein